MNTSSSFQDGFNKLVLDVYRTGGSKALDKINNFYQAYQEQDRDNHLKHQCLLLAGDVLVKQGDLAGASAMYRDILREKASPDDAYMLVVQKAASVLRQLDKQPEATLLLEHALHQPQRNPLQALYLMALHVDTADPQAALPAVFTPLFEWVCSALDVQPAGTDLRAAIATLTAESRNEGKALTLLFATAGEVSKAENVQRLHTFIAGAKVKPFREEAKRYLDSLQTR
jgi:tetratricopeptide (TPR) repeat protein